MHRNKLSLCKIFKNGYKSKCKYNIVDENLVITMTCYMTSLQKYVVNSYRAK